MTEEDRALLEANGSLLGPTLRDRLSLVRAMDRLPLCAICPAAQWYVVEQDRLHCFCTQFRGVIYDHHKRAVVACDARADAIATSTSQR